MKSELLEMYFKNIPLKTKLMVSNRMAFINLICELGYRENKAWSEEENELMAKLTALADKETEHQLEIISESPLEALDSQPSFSLQQAEKVKYLIEDFRTGEWLCLGEMFDSSKDMVEQEKNKWTKDANRAVQWDTKEEAEAHFKKYHNQIDMGVTEHIFSSPSPTFSLQQALDIWDAGGAFRIYYQNRYDGEKFSPNKKQYFLEHFKVDLP